jgi:hypothetical protein
MSVVWNAERDMTANSSSAVLEARVSYMRLVAGSHRLICTVDRIITARISYLARTWDEMEPPVRRLPAGRYSGSVCGALPVVEAAPQISIVVDFFFFFWTEFLFESLSTCASAFEASFPTHLSPPWPQRMTISMT